MNSSGQVKMKLSRLAIDDAAYILLNRASNCQPPHPCELSFHNPDRLRGAIPRIIPHSVIQLVRPDLHIVGHALLHAANVLDRVLSPATVMTFASVISGLWPKRTT